MESKNLTRIDARQQALDLQVKREKVMVEQRYIEKCSSMRDALKLCMDLAPQQEQASCLDLELDQSQWNRVKKGQQHFPDEKYTSILSVCGNYAPLQWYAHDQGFGLVRLQSEVEMENARLKQELEEERRKMAYVAEFMGKVKS